MSNLEPANPKYRVRHGDYWIDFGFDPIKENEPTRFIAFRQGWRSLCRTLYRIASPVYYLGIAFLLGIALWTSFYPEKQIYNVITAAIAFASVYVVRTCRPPIAYFGLVGLLLSALLSVAMLVVSLVPMFARAFAISYVAAHGGEVQVFLHPEFETPNRVMQMIAGRNLIVSEVVVANGPLAAFPPQVVRDLHMPSNSPINLSPGDDSLDWSQHVRAVSPKAPMLNGSLWNPATLQGLTRSELKCDLLIFDREFTEEGLKLLSSPKLRYNTLRLHYMQPEAISKLARLADSGRTLGNLYLDGCQLDAHAAQVLASLDPIVTWNQGQLDDDEVLPLDQLDAIVASGLKIKKVFSVQVTGEQARRLAMIPSLELVSGVLADEEAVENLSGSSLGNIRIAYVTAPIIASLQKYSSLEYVTVDLLEGSPDVILPLLQNPNLFGIVIRKYRGSAAEIANAKRKPWLNILEFEETSMPNE